MQVVLDSEGWRGVIGEAALRGRMQPIVQGSNQSEPYMTSNSVTLELFLAIDAVLDPPGGTPSRGNKQMQPPAIGKPLAAFGFSHKGFNRLVRELCPDTPSHDFLPSSISLDTPDEKGCRWF